MIEALAWGAGICVGLYILLMIVVAVWVAVTGPYHPDFEGHE